MALHSINPATDECFARYEEHSGAEIERLLAAALAAQRGWRERNFASRTEVLNRAAVILRRDREPFAELMAREMGKPLEQGRAEIDKCASCCDFYAARAADFLREESVRTEATSSGVLFQPLGLLLAIMPWNFPFWQVFRAAAPALMAGNGLVLKHASNVCGCALAMGGIFREASLPEGLFNILRVPGARVADIIAHSAIAAVTLTGSTEAGRAVASVAGRHLKKTVLELGGSDPYVVLDDAHLESAAEACAASRLINSGQSCIAAKRFIVDRRVRPKFEQLLVERMQCRRLGDPLSAGTQIGPLARLDLRDALHEQVRKTVQAGGRSLLGGSVPSERGAWYPATVFTGVRPGMAAFDEETFGPVAAVIEAADEAEALALANRTAFGLGAAVFTADLQRGRAFAERMEAGSCFVNDFVRSDPRLPFGGIKDSGYGRELGCLGIREFVNAKTIVVK